MKKRIVAFTFITALGLWGYRQIDLPEGQEFGEFAVDILFVAKIGTSRHTQGDILMIKKTGTHRWNEIDLGEEAANVERDLWFGTISWDTSELAGNTLTRNRENFKVGFEGNFPKRIIHRDTGATICTAR